MKTSKDGFFGSGHTPKYYLKQLAKLGCPEHMLETANDIVNMKPYNEEMGNIKKHDYVKTIWNGDSLYYFITYAEGCFERIQFEFDNGYVDWGFGEC